MTWRERQERNLLRVIVSRCEGYAGVFGPLWEPERPRPLLGFDDALDRLVDVESRLTRLLCEQRRVHFRFFLGTTAVLFTTAGAVALLGGRFDLASLAGLAAIIGLLWMVIAAAWLWGYPIEAEGYWLSSGSASPQTPSLFIYRSLFEELYDAWTGVHQLEASDLRARVEDSGLRLVLIVVEAAWSVQQHPARTSAV